MKIKVPVKLPVVKSLVPPPAQEPSSFAAMVRAAAPFELEGGQKVELGVGETVIPAPPSDWDGADLGCLQAPPPSVVGVIQGVMDRRRKVIPFFRPSGFGGCRRSQIFGYHGYKEEPAQPDDTLSMILDTGTALHTMVQQWLAEHPWVFFAKEIPVWDAELEIKGSSDGMFMFRTADKYGSLYRWGFEYKTISPAGFDGLTGPKPAHVVQASIYAKLMGVWWITIVYQCKGTSRIREFNVHFDQKIWDMVVARVAELKGHVSEGTLPIYDSKECRQSINLCRYVRACHEIEGKPTPSTWGGNR